MALPQWMGSDEIHQARKERGQLWALILQAGCRNAWSLARISA